MKKFNLPDLAINTYELSISLHDEFDLRFDFPTYHNSMHVESLVKCSNVLVAAAIDGNDIFNLQEASTISLEDLAFLFTIAFSLHDIGNILQKKNDTFEFLEHYTAKGAEDRSIDFVKYIFSVVPELQDLQDFVSYIISLTKFVPDAPAYTEKPFHRFVAFCDQVGSGLFTLNKTTSLGILYEMQQEHGGDFMIEDPIGFMNFTRARIKEFQENVLKILGKKLPAEIKNVPKNPMTINELITLFS